MTALIPKRRPVRRRGVVELARTHKLRRGRPAIQVRAAGVVDAADEVVVVVITRTATLVRRSRVRGRPLDARELRLQLAGAEAAIAEVARSQPPVVSSQLTASEAALLDDAGLVEGATDLPSALERSRIDLEVLVRTSLTLADAAAALGVTTSRLRQRLSSRHRTLLGVKQGRSWRIPQFQFEARGTLVRGIEAVLPRIRGDAHPLAIRDWFTTPHQDLVVDDGQRAAPRAWLSSGRPPEIVAALAEEI